MKSDYVTSGDVVKMNLKKVEHVHTYTLTHTYIHTYIYTYRGFYDQSQYN